MFGLVGHVGAAMLALPSLLFLMGASASTLLLHSLFEMGFSGVRSSRGRSSRVSASLPDAFGQAGKKLLIALAEITPNNGAQELVNNLVPRGKTGPLEQCADPSEMAIAADNSPRVIQSEDERRKFIRNFLGCSDVNKVMPFSSIG